jgi:DNA-binding CsgD family transcriptional regulator
VPEPTREGHLSKRIPMLGFSFMVASNFMLLKSFPPSSAVTGAPLDFASYPVVELLAFLVASAVCAATMGVLSARHRRRSSGRNLLLAALVLSAVGIVCAGVKDLLFGAVGQSVGYALMCGALIGVGNTIMTLLWGRAYTAHAREAIPCAAFSFALGITVCMSSWLLLDGSVLWICRLVCHILSVLSLFPQLADGGSHNRSQVVDTSEWQAGWKRRLVKGLWKPLVGLFLFSLMLGVYWARYASDVFVGFAVEVVVIWLVAAVLAASVSSRWGKRRRSDSSEAEAAKDEKARDASNDEGSVRHGLQTVYAVAIPVATVLLLADPFLMAVGSQMEPLSGVTWSACFVVFEVVAWCALAIASSRVPVHSDTLFGASRTCEMCALVVGLVLGQYIESVALNLLLTSVVVVYAIALVVARPTVVPAPESVEASEPPSSQDTVAAIAKQFGLSNRETEVFALLVQGYGEPYISSHLYISANTVKTHRRHIYTKLGVGSREELINFAHSYRKPEEGSHPGAPV